MTLDLWRARKLQRKGLTLREIAAELGESYWAVMWALYGANEAPFEVATAVTIEAVAVQTTESQAKADDEAEVATESEASGESVSRRAGGRTPAATSEQMDATAGRDRHRAHPASGLNSGFGSARDASAMLHPGVADGPTALALQAGTAVTAGRDRHQHFEPAPEPETAQGAAGESTAARMDVGQVIGGEEDGAAFDAGAITSQAGTQAPPVDAPSRPTTGPRRFRLRQGRGHGKFLHKSGSKLTPDLEAAWAGTMAQVGAVQDHYELAADLIEEAIEDTRGEPSPSTGWAGPEGDGQR